jgi:hypothetical protein
MADEMNDAGLNDRLRKDGVDRLGKAIHTIRCPLVVSSVVAMSRSSPLTRRNVGVATNQQPSLSNDRPPRQAGIANKGKILDPMRIGRFSMEFPLRRNL